MNKAIRTQFYTWSYGIRDRITIDPALDQKNADNPSKNRIYRHFLTNEKLT